MKKKAIQEPVISPEILEMAKKSVDVERRPAQKLCAVCGSACSSNNTFLQNSTDENLCWICRRLKISAWRDSDQQVSAQE